METNEKSMDDICSAPTLTAWGDEDSHVRIMSGGVIMIEHRGKVVVKTVAGWVALAQMAGLAEQFGPEPPACMCSSCAIDWKRAMYDAARNATKGE